MPERMVRKLTPALSHHRRRRRNNFANRCQIWRVSAEIDNLSYSLQMNGGSDVGFDTKVGALRCHIYRLHFCRDRHLVHEPIASRFETDFPPNSLHIVVTSDPPNDRMNLRRWTLFDDTRRTLIHKNRERACARLHFFRQSSPYF
jgi:hypothetical protein